MVSGLHVLLLTLVLGQWTNFSHIRFYLTVFTSICPKPFAFTMFMLMLSLSFFLSRWGVLNSMTKGETVAGLHSLLLSWWLLAASYFSGDVPPQHGRSLVQQMVNWWWFTQEIMRIKWAANRNEIGSSFSPVLCAWSQSDASTRVTHIRSASSSLNCAAPWRVSSPS